MGNFVTCKFYGNDRAIFNLVLDLSQDCFQSICLVAYLCFGPRLLSHFSASKGQNGSEKDVKHIYALEL